MILKEIQKHLQKLYQLHIPYNIEKYILKKRKGGSIEIGDRCHREVFLIHQKENQLEIGLYIEANILTLLKKQNPFQQLTQANLDSFFVAIEGVSHFIYFLSRAQNNQELTQLEMELQAEIDKYLLATFVFEYQHKNQPHFLLQYLFENYGLPEDLNVEERLRYQEANRFALKFCAQLETNYLKHKRWNEALSCARQFYHLNHWDKIRSLMP